MNLKMVHGDLVKAAQSFNMGYDEWLYRTNNDNIFVLSDEVLGPGERAALGLKFIVSTGSIVSYIQQMAEPLDVAKLREGDETDGQ